METSIHDRAGEVLADVRAVVETVIGVLSGEDMKQAQIQFRAIAKAVEQIESTGGSVPAELRNMRASLAVEVGEVDRAQQTGQMLLEGLQAEVGRLIAAGVGGHTRRPRPGGPRRGRSPSSSMVTGSIPISVSVEGFPRLVVSTWREVLVGVFDMILEARPDVLPTVLGWRSRRGEFLSTTGLGMRQPAVLRTGRYIDAHRSAADINRQVLRLLGACGIDPSALHIETRRST